MGVFVDLVVGYYAASRRAGYGFGCGLGTGVYLAVVCCWDKIVAEK